MRTMMSAAQAGLVRALYAVAEKTLPDVRADPEALVIAQQQVEPWASITFSGQRHHIALCLGGPVAQQEKLARALEEAVAHMECRITGHYLVDALVRRLCTEEDAGVVRTRMEIEAVTLLED